MQKSHIAGYFENEVAEWCWFMEDFVICKAPIFCNSECSKYRAKRVTGVKARTLTTSDGAKIRLHTGFIDGCKLRLVSVSSRK